jgi:dihydroorotate dehydrogenase
LIYKLIFNLVFARLNPELAHHLVMAGIRFAGLIGLTRILKLRPTGRGSVQAFGLHFDSPFGLAAGFDKNAVAVKALGELGFSHVEIGTVTAVPQSGNEKPRLFRLIQDRALINRMGFNNQGAEKIAARLKRLRQKHGSKLPIVGVNIGKSRIVAVEDAIKDYRLSAQLLAPHADYLAVNVSSPNTPGLRSLQSIDALKPILQAVLEQSQGKPVLVKIAPDLVDEDVLAVADLCLHLGLAGVIATNTTVGRNSLTTEPAVVDSIGAGGLSGPPVAKRSIEILQLLQARMNNRAAIISVGGIETPADAALRMENGATLIQGYTGWIYQGPLWARSINKFLTK